MKRVLIFLFFLVQGFSGFCTRQIRDIIILNSDTLYSSALPLQPYFKKAKNRSLPGFKGLPSTACWRGYQAIWIIRDNKFYLSKIRSCHQLSGIETADANLKEMFGNKCINNEVLADWYSGTLIISKGRRIRDCHVKYSTIYEEEIHLKIKNGNIVGRKQFINYDSRETNFDRSNLDFLLDTIVRHISSNIDWNRFLQNDMYYGDRYAIVIDKDGRIRKVQYYNLYYRDDKSLSASFYRFLFLFYDPLGCATTIKKSLLNFPQLNLLRKEHKRISEVLDIEIQVDSSNHTILRTTY